MDDALGNILVVPDLLDGSLSSHDLDVLGAAQNFAARAGLAVAVLAISSSPETDWPAYGVDRLIRLRRPGTYAPEWDMLAVAAAVDVLAPKHLFAADINPGAGDVLRRLAIRKGLKVAANVIDVTAERVCSVVDGGCKEAREAVPDVVLLSPECAFQPNGSLSEARPVMLQPPPNNGDMDILCLGEVRTPRNMMRLDDADFVVAAGAGVTDWTVFHAVTLALDATEGGSRVVCDAGLMPKSRQIGASGTLVGAECYFALGISGAPQHVQGIASCRHVIAVNTDLHAAMIKRADLAIVADAQAVMASLLKIIGTGGENL